MPNYPLTLDLINPSGTLNFWLAFPAFRLAAELG
jgi:hypothetical protein